MTKVFRKLGYITIISLLIIIFNSCKKDKIETVKIHTVTFNAGEGASTVKAQKIENNKKSTKPSNPTKKDYTFIEWDLDGKVFDFDTPITKSITLTAKWVKDTEIHTAVYTVTFKSGEGASTVESQKIKHNKKSTKPSNPTKKDYTFIEWDLDGKAFDFDTPITKSITLIAKWVKDTEIHTAVYTVTFNAGEGASTVESQKIKHNEKITKPSDPIKADYKFIEWQLNGETFDFNTAVTQSINLVAIWEVALEGSLDDWDVTPKGDGITLVLYKGSATEIVIPTLIEGKNVLSIYNDEDTGIFNQDESSSNTTTTKVDMSKAIYLQCVGENSFQYCTSLSEVVLPENITEIKNRAFLGDESLVKINFPNNLQYIRARAFKYCTSLTEAVLPNNIKEIGELAFYSCESLSKVTLPSNLEKIKNRAFKSCKALQSIYIPNTVTLIGELAFYGCETLTNINLPNNLQELQNRTFKNCHALASITLPSSLTKIGYKAFYHCEALESITITENVEEIGDETFKNCTALSIVNIEKSTSPLTIAKTNVFESTNASLKIYYPSGADYINESSWSDYTSMMEAK